MWFPFITTIIHIYNFGGRVRSSKRWMQMIKAKLLKEKPRSMKFMLSQFSVKTSPDVRIAAIAEIENF